MSRNSTKRTARAEPPIPARRKGASRMSEIPADVLAGLNEGRLEAVTLVEWLAIDVSVLLRHVLPTVGLARGARPILAAAEELRAQGVTRRMWGVGKLLHGALRDSPGRSSVLDRLAAHPSDMARAWAAYAVASDDGLSL